MRFSWKQILLLIALPAIPAIVLAAEPFSDGDSGTASVAGCRGWDPNNISCAASKLEQRVANDGVPAALKDLKGQIASGGLRSTSCHQLTHAIGRAATERYPSVGAAFRAGSQMCGAGYYHGAMEGIVVELGARTVTQRIPVLCREPAKEGRYAIKHYSCAHGLGHGLLGISDGIPTALGRCERFRDANERRYCYSGVFMENTRPHGGSGYQENAGEERLRSVCPTLKGVPRSVCFQRLPQDEAFAARTDFRVIMPVCKALPPQDGAGCHKGMGGLAANLATIQIGEGPERYAAAAGLCQLATTREGETLCFSGAAVNFVYNERSIAGAEALCGAAPPTVRKVCLGVAAEHFQTLYGGNASPPMSG